MEYLPLIGVAVVVVGFLLRLRVTVIVVAAGLAAGLAGGLPLIGSDIEPGIIDTLGRAFANTRIISLWVLTLPAIGLAERYGLQEQARRVFSSSGGNGGTAPIDLPVLPNGRCGRRDKAWKRACGIFKTARFADGTRCGESQEQWSGI